MKKKRIKIPIFIDKLCYLLELDGCQMKIRAIELTRVMEKQI
jgi:hypothetical protein